MNEGKSLTTSTDQSSRGADGQSVAPSVQTENETSPDIAVFSCDQLRDDVAQTVKPTDTQTETAIAVDKDGNTEILQACPIVVRLIAPDVWLRLECSLCNSNVIRAKRWFRGMSGLKSHLAKKHASQTIAYDQAFILNRCVVETLSVTQVCDVIKNPGMIPGWLDGVQVQVDVPMDSVVPMNEIKESSELESESSDDLPPSRNRRAVRPTRRYSPTPGRRSVEPPVRRPQRVVKQLYQPRALSDDEFVYEEV